jgi:predicted PurR-regulated permease PerM
MLARRRVPDALHAGGHPRAPEPFQHRVIFTAAVCAATLVLLVLLWKGRYMILCLFGGVIGAVLLSSMTKWVQSRLHIRRALALTLVLVVITASLVGVTMLRGPALAQQLGALQTDVPQAFAQIVGQMEEQHWGHWILTRISDALSPPGGISFAISGIRGVLTVTAYTVIGLVLMLFTSLFLAAEPGFYLRGLQRATPVRYRATLRRCLATVNSSLESWLFAKFLSMVIIGVMVTAGLWILRVPMPGTLGTLAGILTFIPNVGPILSVVPAALLAFAISPSRGMLTILLYLVVHFLEGNLVTPLAERSIVTLPPALTLTMQLLLASVTGALGVALAAPITAVMLGALDALLPPASATPNVPHPPGQPTSSDY